LRVSWLADHLDAVLAQTLASRAYRAQSQGVPRPGTPWLWACSRGRGLRSVENKRNETGLRFLLQQPEVGSVGYLLWQGDQLPALIDWNDPVVTHGLNHRVKYARLIQRPASSARAQGADAPPPALFCPGSPGGRPVSETETSCRQRHGRTRSHVPPRLPSCPERGKPAWTCCVPNWLLMPKSFEDSSGRWSGSDGPTPQTIMMSVGG
jgi:hypothetical protein